MNNINNPKIEVPKGIKLNDKDELNILNTYLKELEKNMAIALTEASNEKLYNEYKEMFDNIAKMQRDIYEVMFKFGWYTLEEVAKTKISTLLKNLNTELTNLK